jgi:hypothetical protein
VPADALPEVDREVAPSLPNAPEVNYWAERGIRFEGTWHEDELQQVLDVLARFAARLGEARLIALMRKGVRLGTEGRSEVLTLIRDPDAVDSLARYLPKQGRIHFHDGTFDQVTIDADFYYPFQDRLRDATSGSVTDPMFIIGHELGHVLIYGLRSEQTASGQGATFLEDLYGDALIVNHWAHPLYDPNESVASEIALWVFEVDRPTPVETFRDENLVPALLVGSSGK